MASTYSNLKIQLMATGENSTTWGDVTNVNLGTALEEAIAGSADVAFASADVTLSLSNTNASQSARNMRLNLTGTATAGYNLIVPAIEKPYIINNATDGTITVKNTTGTGIAVPTGKTTWVFNNGTNVVDVTTHLTSLTLGTFLPIASGGTGGNTASAARTALGATTVGGNVFTLTNPSAITFPRFNADNTVSALDAATFRSAIGAGTSSTTGTVTSVGGTGTVNGLTLTGTVTSSGNLTLGGTLSGVSLTTQVTGTLPIANGGTGATDAATARSNLGAGTGNGSVTSVGGTGTVNGLTLTGTVTTSGSLTLGGTLSGVALGSQVSGTLPVANGGTGATDAATARSNLGAGTGNGTVTSVATAGTVNGITLTGTVTSSGTLTLGGTLSGVSLTSQVTGTLPIANGGTGATDAATALTSLGAYAASNPSGFTSNTGTVTSVGGTGSPNGLSLSGTVTSSGNITLGGSVTSVASGATIDGVVIGYRNIPRSTTSGTATTGDVGKVIAVTAGITIPNATFAAGDAVSIYNDSASSITITAGVTTLRQAGTTNTGNRTLAARGMATVWFNSSSEAIISGAGVT
jgi:hypothetical protein